MLNIFTFTSTSIASSANSNTFQQKHFQVNPDSMSEIHVKFSFRIEYTRVNIVDTVNEKENVHFYFGSLHSQFPSWAYDLSIKGMPGISDSPTDTINCVQISKFKFQHSILSMILIRTIHTFKAELFCSERRKVLFGRSLQ